MQLWQSPPGDTRGGHGKIFLLKTADILNPKALRTPRACLAVRQVFASAISMGIVSEPLE